MNSNGSVVFKGKKVLVKRDMIQQLIDFKNQ